MSRIAKQPINIPEKVSFEDDKNVWFVSGPNGKLSLKKNRFVKIKNTDNSIIVEATDDSQISNAMSGTIRSLLNNMVVGVTDGFEKNLQLVGVGYRAQSKGSILSLNLGFSHPVDYEIPQGIKVETPSQTEIIVKGSDKQLVGQVAAEIRFFRPPEPYKGKGVRYKDETITLKETKKK
jgi:large subunit ribosomal protein L6